MAWVLIRGGPLPSAQAKPVFVWNVILHGRCRILTRLAVFMGVALVRDRAEMIRGQFGVGLFTWEAYSLCELPGNRAGISRSACSGWSAS